MDEPGPAGGAPCRTGEPGSADGPPPLRAVQQYFQDAIILPFPHLDHASELLAATGALSPERRLELYRRGCRRRLLEVLRHRHPGLRALLGADLFDAFAGEYLDACPPRSYTLARLDDRLAGHLAAHRPDRDLPAARREFWIDLMIDIVRYECLFAEVYDGPGTEGTPPAPEPAGLPGPVTAIPAPGLRLFRACAAVHEYHSAVRSGTRPAPPAPEPSNLVVFRRDYRVVTVRPPAQAFGLLTALLSGLTLDTAAARAGLGSDTARWYMRRWVAQRWITARLPKSVSSEPPQPPRQEILR
jgi:hypothetical protein